MTKTTTKTWGEMSKTDRDSQTRILGARPIRWTLDISLVNSSDPDGRIYVFAGGPIEAPHVKKVLKTREGKIDGRSASVRKCGRCGHGGHNARTCGKSK